VEADVLSRMAYSNYDRYFETEVLTADPMKLVAMLYRAAIESVQMARRHLAAGEIRERAQKVMKAWRIVQELRQSLDDRGGDLTRSLRDLYTYMQGRLIAANAQQQDAPLAEVETLLATLHQGWQAASNSITAGAAETESYEPVSWTY
jgi:flagellar secretion chaperone FliS